MIYRSTYGQLTILAVLLHRRVLNVYKKERNCSEFCYQTTPTCFVQFVDHDWTVHLCILDCLDYERRTAGRWVNVLRYRLYL
jgi:hypothetical protein